MNSPDVNIDICLVELQTKLAGYRGYPSSLAGEKRFAFALQENCVSVGHLRAVLASFDEAFPTVRQIHDVAANLRPQFETAVDQHAEWERQYGKAEAFKYPADRRALHWQVFRDTLYYTEGPGVDNSSFWVEKLQRDAVHHADSHAFVREMVKAHGWPAVRNMEAAPEGMPYRSPNTRAPRHFANVGAPITHADIQRAESERRKSTKQVDRELDSDSRDDPDR